MAVYFNFTNGDDHITQNLTATEISGVTTWQDTSLDYDFSFHEMHEAGYPLYVCKSSGHGQRNMPKIDTKGKTSATFVNGEKLTKAQREDAKAVVNANWALFAKLAREYYDPPTTAPVVTPTSIACKNPKCGIDIPLSQGTNADGYYVCPKCGKWTK
jgi:hypothetical protein